MVGTGIQFLNRVKVRGENQPNLAEEIEEGDRINKKDCPGAIKSI